MNRDAERPTDFPIGQRHAFTVTVRELERQLGFTIGIGYTSHHAISLHARDIVPCLYDARCLGDASLDAGSGD